MGKEKTKFYTYKLNMTILNVLSIVLMIVVGAIVLFIERNDNYDITMSFGLFILMFIWLIIHELLHGVGFAIFKEVSIKNLSLGMFLEKGVFYCMCKQKISKKVILTSLLFPLSIIGIITLIIGMIINSYTLVFLSITNIVSSIGDIVMTVYFLKTPNDIIYLDLDDCTSFTVLSSKSLDNIMVLGIELDKTGEYNPKEMVSKDKRKIVISKLSYVLLIIVFILSLITLIK